VFPDAECIRSWLLWPDENYDNSTFGKSIDFADFKKEVLIMPYLYFSPRHSATDEEFVFTYTNNQDTKLKKSEKLTLLFKRAHKNKFDQIAEKTASLCNCLKSDYASFMECRAEAHAITAAYFEMWQKYANSSESFGYAFTPYEPLSLNKPPDYMAGWMCFHWAYFTHKALHDFSPKYFKIQRSGYWNFDEGKMLHNWVTLFVCDELFGREAKNGIHFDPWVGKSIGVYSAAEHESALGVERNYITKAPPDKYFYDGLVVYPDGSIGTFYKYGYHTRWPEFHAKRPVTDEDNF
jgi:hypothetical protein